MNECYCIGCGCSDYAACLDDQAGGCWWLAKLPGSHWGICSACGDLYERTAAERFSFAPNYSALRFVHLLEPIYGPVEAMQWFEAPQKLLGRLSPRQAIADGRIRDVRRQVDALLDGAYL